MLCFTRPQGGIGNHLITRPEHVSDKVCSCHYCTCIDIVFGDPLLTPWERNFIDSVARQGWERDYSIKQKAVIDKIHTRLFSERTKS